MPPEAITGGSVEDHLRAALAEKDRQLDTQMLLLKACDEIAEGNEGWEVLRNECPSTQSVARLRDALAEREAQSVALRDALSASLEQLRRHADTDAGLYDWQRVLTSTADAAARCLARARQEGAEELVARVVRFLAHDPTCPSVRTTIGTRWRDGDTAMCSCGLAGALAARRG